MSDWKGLAVNRTLVRKQKLKGREQLLATSEEEVTKQKEEKGDRREKLMLAAVYRQFFTRHARTAGIKERKLVCCLGCVVYNNCRGKSREITGGKQTGAYSILTAL